VDASGRGLSTRPCAGGMTWSGEACLTIATGDAGVRTAAGFRIITGLSSLTAAEAVAVDGGAIVPEPRAESTLEESRSVGVVSCPEYQAPLVVANPISTPTTIPRRGYRRATKERGRSPSGRQLKSCMFAAAFRTRAEGMFNPLDNSIVEAPLFYRIRHGEAADHLSSTTKHRLLIDHRLSHGA